MAVSRTGNGKGRVNESAARTSTPEAENQQRESPKAPKAPKLSPRPARSPAKESGQRGKRLKKAETAKSIPVLRGRSTKPPHERQHSAPSVTRRVGHAQARHGETMGGEVAAFDAALTEGTMAVTLDSGPQFRRFLAWVPGKPVHSLVINDSLWGLERDMQALLSTRSVDKIRQRYRESPGIADIVEALPGLRSLDISRCDPSEPDLLKLLHLLHDPACGLTSLQADRLYWGGGMVVKSLIGGLAGPVRLKRLSMTGAMGEALTPHVILHALRTNTTLQEIDFSVSGQRGAADPDDVATTIFLNTHLKKLAITTHRFISEADNRFGDDPPADFRFNDLTIYHWMSAFLKNKTLEVLSIRGAPLPAAIVEAIMKTLADNPAIRTIDLAESGENKAALQELQGMLGERRRAMQAAATALASSASSADSAQEASTA